MATKRVEDRGRHAHGLDQAAEAFRDKLARYRLQVWSTDEAEIDSEIHAVWVDIGP